MELVSKEKVYGCERCKISSLTEGRWCPCPRGGCDAEVIGTKYVTVSLDKEFDLNLKDVEE